METNKTLIAGRLVQGSEVIQELNSPGEGRVQTMNEDPKNRGSM
jgi:hypothetical protein